MFVLPLSRTTARATLPVRRQAVSPQFSRVLDRLFDDSFDRYFGGTPAGEPARTPALDVTETDTHYTVTLDVPGVSREQLKVSVEGRKVSVESIDATPAEAATPVAEGSEAPKAAAAPRVLYRERSTARYARTVSLPAEVDQASSQAKFDNGVLTLTLAKKVAAGATRISIN